MARPGCRKCSGGLLTHLCPQSTPDCLHILCLCVGPRPKLEGLSTLIVRPPTELSTNKGQGRGCLTGALQEAERTHSTGSHVPTAGNVLNWHPRHGPLPFPLSFPPLLCPTQVTSTSTAPAGFASWSSEFRHTPAAWPPLQRPLSPPGSYRRGL